MRKAIRLGKGDFGHFPAVFAAGRLLVRMWHGQIVVGQ
jgi:hypothetical protein